MSQVSLLMHKISKEFPGVKALDQVSFSVEPGEIHSICGENGAGKSTLMKIMSGALAKDQFSGQIFINDVIQNFNNIRESERAGIAIVHQELSLIPDLSIGENIFIGREPSRLGVIKWDELYSKALKLMSTVGLEVDPRTQVKSLGIGQQQQVEIAKALSHHPRFLILDEPTSALTSCEVELLKKILLSLRKQGVGCVLISHKLDEVMDISDRITVLRDGKIISTSRKSDTNQKKIISEMVGRELGDFYPLKNQCFAETVMTVRNLCVPGKLENISFDLHRGEILGFSGLVGAGRTELLMTLFGAMENFKVSGSISIDGKRYLMKSPQDALNAGLALLTEDRKRFGVILDQDIFENMTLASLNQFTKYGLIQPHCIVKTVNQESKILSIKSKSIDSKVKQLSGGNQQKVVLAKWLLTNPKILLLDEPTRGIDMGAKKEIYQILNDLAVKGMSIVLVSSELPEILGLSHRVLVMSKGKITGEFKNNEATQEKILASALGEVFV